MPKLKYPYQFDPKKRKIAKSYRRGRLSLFLIGVSVSVITSILILATGFSVTLREFVYQYPLPTLFYGFLILLTFSIVGFPLAYYSTLVFDRKFNLSRYTFLGWFKDYLKINLIGYVISLFLISVLYFTIRNLSPWWIFAGIFYIIFNITMNYVYPLIIIPFMWKTESYKDKSMKSKILALCRKLGVTNIKNIVVIKESEKSVRPNAVFMGFGNSRRIGLFDTLLNSFTKDEIETVVGHELGHYVNKDILRGMILESILIFPMLFAVDYFVELISPIFGISGIADIASLPLIALVYGILGFIVMPLNNTHSRWREAEADKFALEHVGKSNAQVSTEKRLADTHLAELDPHPLMEFWLFTHPSTIKRIRMAQRWRKRK